MPIEVTLNIFSGRQNPNWALSAAQEKDLLDLLETIKTPTLSKPSGVTGRLGYRGRQTSRAVNDETLLSRWLKEGVQLVEQEKP